jgi:hypothetical protein
MNDDIVKSLLMDQQSKRAIACFRQQSRTQSGSESVAHYLGIAVLVPVVFGTGVEYLAMICHLPSVFFQMSTS